MNARIESMCHGDGKVYLQMVLDRLHRDSQVVLDARLKDGTELPAHLFPFTPLDPASAANYVIVLPHLDVREVDLSFVEYREDAPLSQSRLSVELNMMKWRTRINTLVHNELTQQMFDIEREYCANRMNIYFTDAIEDGNEIVVKMFVDMPHVEGTDVTVRFADVYGGEIDLPVYPLVDEVSPAVRLGDEDRLHIGFSVRVAKGQKDFCVTAFDAQELVAGSFAVFNDETYEPLHDLARFLATHANANKQYEDWYYRKCATLAQLSLQREYAFNLQPKISLVMPVSSEDYGYLYLTLPALLRQTYENFELVVVEVGEDSARFDAAFSQWGDDARLTRLILDAGSDEATACVTGLLQASGEVRAVLEPRVILAPEALFEFVRCFNEQGGVDVAYVNHDHLDEHGGLCKPEMKPVYSPDLMLSYNYMGPLVFISKALIEEVAQNEGFATESFCYDLFIKAAARAKKVQRIDAVLCHVQNASATSAEAQTAQAKRDEEAFRGGRKAVASHLRRTGTEAVVLSELSERMYRVRYRLPEPAPSLSVVIPSKEQPDMLEQCIASVLENNEFRAFEIVVVDSGNPSEETKQLYREIKQRHSAFKVFSFEGKFSYAAAVNFAVSRCDSSFIMLLDDDTEMITPNAVASMLAHCAVSHVGVVGAKLLFADDTIQHAGIMVGPYGTAGNIGVNLPRSSQGYMRRFVCSHNVSAVSSAAMMIKKSVFEEVGGFNPKFQTGSYDVDFCLKVNKAGYFVVFDGDVELYHQENATAGHALTHDERLRAEREQSYLRYLWPRHFVDGDPFMSACLDPRSPYYHLSASHSS